MKRYLLFAGAWYYPKGGVADLKGSFGTESEAKEEGERMVAEVGVYAEMIDWFHVVDSESFIKVAEGERKEGK